MGKNLKYAGSVKNIWESDTDLDSLYFEFTDKYSIFDWGEMPDLIESKGRALSLMAESFFKLLDFPNHFEGREDQFLKVRKVNVLAPTKNEKGYNYDIYTERPSNCLIPLEVVFRLGIPQGSSLIKRSNNQVYMKSIGFEKSEILEGNWLNRPCIEFSTKLEPSDRYLSFEEAQKISGLNDQEFEQLKQAAIDLSKKLQRVFADLNIELWDGKFEFAFDENRKLVLVDSIGPDELRLLFKGVHLSKEILRQYYKESEWLQEVKSADKSDHTWKLKVTSKPHKLEPNFKNSVSKMYQKLAIDICKKANVECEFIVNESLSEIVNNLEIL